MYTTTSDGFDQYFIVRAEYSYRANPHVVPVFHGVYRSIEDAWLKIDEVIDHLNKQSQEHGNGWGTTFIQDRWVGNLWQNDNGHTAILSITAVHAR